jgi:hypothetical protein
VCFSAAKNEEEQHVGHVFELEESDFAGYIEDGEVYRATVRNVRVREGKFVDDRTGEKPNRVEFVFKLISDDEHDGQDVWGDTSTKFNTHPNCVAEDTEIVPIGHLIAATRGPYQGRAVRVDTRKGESLHITPNHPVLTARGWVPAGGLTAGDRVLRHGCGDAQSVRADLDHHPARAGEIYESLVQVEPPLLIATAPSDFHGDGAWIEGPIEATGQGSGRYRVDVVFDPALVPDLVDRRPGGTPPRRVHVNAANGRPRYGGHVDVPGFVATDLLVDLYGAGSKHVELDVIERVTEQAFAGPVYNFHTTGSAYFAAGLAVHNCRLKTWAEAILGQRLPPHYRLDTDMLLDKECRVMVGKRDYEKDGQVKSANFVSEVHPSRANVEALAVADAEPF